MKEPCRGWRQGSKASKTREKVRGSLMECCSLDGADQAGSGTFSTPGGASRAPSAARFSWLASHHAAPFVPLSVHPVEHDGRQLGSNRSPDRLRWGLRGMPPWAETQGLEAPPPAEEPPQRRMRQRGWWVRLPNCPRARARMFDVPWVFLSCIRVPPQQSAPTQARVQLILLSQLQIAPAIALDPVQEGREPRAGLDRVRIKLRPCTTR